MKATVKADWITRGKTLRGSSSTPHRIERARTEWPHGEPVLVVTTRCGKEFFEPEIGQSAPHPYWACKPCSREPFYVVYRAYNANGRLLYVGLTGNFPSRMRAHRQASEWWKYTARVVQRHHSTRATAAAAEIEAIREERPLFNRAHAVVVPLSKRALRKKATA